MNACCETPGFEAARCPVAGSTLKTVVLIGPPNSGKSTLFNKLTGLRQKVANYPGVTVEQRKGLMAGVGRDDLTLIDLPGIYSLTPYSEDARVAVDVLRGRMPGTPKPDAVLLVLDSLHLTRQLMLAQPVLAVGLPTLVLLNMIDLMESRGGYIDALKLARELDAPVAQISAVHGTGHRRRPALSESAERPRERPIALSCPSSATRPARTTGPRRSAAAPATRLRCRLNNTRKIDNVLLHRIWGPLLFLLVVVGVFEVVFCARPAALGRLWRSAGARCRSRASAAARGLAAIAAARRRVEGHLVGAGFPAADPASVPLHRSSRRLRLSGARGSDRRPFHADYRPERQSLHPAALCLRVRDSRHHGHAHHREQARPPRHDSWSRPS